jgi:hypothetical protein
MQALREIEMRNSKAAGIYEIPAEILKADLNVTADALRPLFMIFGQQSYYKHHHLTITF